MDDRQDGRGVFTDIDPGKRTKGVETLMGDPKKAITKLAWPMILAMSVQTIYTLVDAVWVAGLGVDALAAVGFSFPFFFMAMALAAGLGMGGGSAISRRIGARDKKGADSVAAHIMVLTVMVSTLFTIVMFTFARPIFLAIGAGDTIDLTLEYALIIIAGMPIMFFGMVSNSILRSEGDVKRASMAMVLGSVLNMVLDPIFIYVLGFGVAGAAMATVLSFSVTAAFLFYWLFVKQDTHVTFRFSGFRFQKDIMRDIFKVGLPAMVMQTSMSITMLAVNYIIVVVAGTDGVAIYTTGWRVSSLAILPLLGIATAVTSVCGAAYGAKDYDKLRAAFFYAMKLGLILEVAAAVVTVALAPSIAAVFTRTEDSAHMVDDLVLFLVIMGAFYPVVVFGMLSSAMFQGTGKGMNALTVTLIRTVILTPPLVLLFVYPVDMGLTGVWWGIVLANLIGATVAFLWAYSYICGLKGEFEKDKACALPGKRGGRDDRGGKKGPRKKKGHGSGKKSAYPRKRKSKPASDEDVSNSAD